MNDNYLLCELCHIVCVRYDLQTERQRARSKVGYYNRLYYFVFICTNPALVPKPKMASFQKWKKLGRLALKAEIKKHRAAQLLAESKLDLLSSKTTKRVRYLTKELKASLIYASGQNKVHTIRINGKFLEHKQVRDLADLFAAETLLLKGEEINYA